ncbi:hypothetical protein [Desulfolithobacter sp.]
MPPHWAHQSITGRMLETVRKGYWSAPEPVQKKLAVEYALSVVEKFKLAIEQAAQVSLAEQAAERKAQQKMIHSPGRDKAAKKRKSDSLKQEMTEVEGYRMEKMKRQDDSTQVTSSGVEWLAGLVILFIIGLMAYGVRKKGY